jgi:hypothetical protein
VLDQLTLSRGIFDEETQKITKEIKELSDIEESAGLPPSQGTTATKHAWLRGALASIGQYILRQTKESTN